MLASLCLKCVLKQCVSINIEVQCRGRTNWLQELDALVEVPHECEHADSLTESWDFPKLGHEAVFLGELQHRAAFTLVILDQLQLVVGRDETLQLLQKI